jgi:hypothetical protein
MRRDAMPWFSDQHTAEQIQCHEITSWLVLGA